jgi:carboxyl-terminal processing protease
MKFENKYLPILLSATLALGVGIGGWLSIANAPNLVASNASKSKLNSLIDFINNEYVDEVNTDSIVNLTVDNILAKLDPHSVYIPPSVQTQVAENMKGDFVGIGISFYMYKDTVAVIKPVPNGPSAKAGIQAGDRLLYAGKTKLFGRNLPSDSLFAKLKGTVGSDIEVIVYRKNTHQKLKINIKRAVIPIKSVDIALMLNPTVGYLKINRFAETTFAEFSAGLAQLKKQGAQTVVLDLRDNGGGYMEEAASIADHFLKENELIVFTKNKSGDISKTFATNKGVFETGRLFVLINENSASASEILAGAIQDNDRGTIVGRRSFGKGLVQREMDFKDGSAVRLTVARYYTPSGRSIQKPYAKGNAEYFKESGHRFLNGELYHKDSIKIADTLKFKTKKGKLIYGGGGIVPDVFVPIGTEKEQENAVLLEQSGMIGYFVFETLDQDRKAFKGLSFQEFEKEYHAEKYLALFQNYLKLNGVLLSLDKSKTMVNYYIMAEFAKQLFGEEYYYQIVLKQDEMVKKVLTKK